MSVREKIGLAANVKARQAKESLDGSVEDRIYDLETKVSNLETRLANYEAHKHDYTDATISDTEDGTGTESTTTKTTTGVK
jgi:hypothetical protein